MVYYMGDIHGNPLPAVFACRQMNMTHEDTLVLLGDVGANYYGVNVTPVSNEVSCKIRAENSLHPWQPRNAPREYYIIFL